MKTSKVAAISINANSLKHDSRYDFALEAFAKGTKSQLLSAGCVKERPMTMIARGVSESVGYWIRECQNNNLPFYHIDSGYFGNPKSKKWHRVTFNEMQNTSVIKDRPADRLEMILNKSWTDLYKPITPGKKILICPPSKKVMNFFNQGTPENWTNNIVTQLQQLTDRPIEIRLKPSSTDRSVYKTLKKALSEDVYCLVTYNSIAATEARLEGKPALTLGPNAAQTICETNLNNIENLKIPTKDEVYAFLTHLSHCQFTISEMKEGIHWKYLNC